MENKILLSVKDLSVAFGHGLSSANHVVNKISFDIYENEKMTLVGESGSGKSVTALSLLQLHDSSQTFYPDGEILFEGKDLLKLNEAELRQVRGDDIAMIFQEPMTALNPVYRIGEQLIEPLLLHQGIGRDAARKRVIELLDRTGIVEPHKRIDAYPHMLSGGQRQRVMIAMALACQPKLLIADEPTTALDVTIQAQILELLEELQKDFSMAILMITHDLNMVKRFADRVCVMQQGNLVEQNTVKELFANPQHDYTRHLLQSQPEVLVNSDEQLDSQPLLQGNNLKCYFPVKSGFFNKRVGDIKAVDDVSINIQPGETLGIVGESGSGKTTLGMCLLRLESCDGTIIFNGNDIHDLTERQLRPMRKDMQIVFQDPFSSLSPRMTVKQIIQEGLDLHFPHLDEKEKYRRVVNVIREVGLEEAMLSRYPHEFSGGQRQRIAIARVVVLEPKLILLDEPTSALDVSVQKQVLSLLRDLQQKLNISYLFITHDLRVIRAMAHRVMVMKDGRVIEQGQTGEIFENPQQEYTRTLLNASLFLN